jgi:hypothetical protein
MGKGAVANGHASAKASLTVERFQMRAGMRSRRAWASVTVSEVVRSCNGVVIGKMGRSSSSKAAGQSLP